MTEEAGGSSADGRFDSGRLPTGFQLRSALRVGRLIDGAGTPLADARNSYRLVPTGGLYRSEDLVVGEEVLLAAGLLHEHDDVLYPADGLFELSRAGDGDGCEALLYTLLGHRPPLWLRAASSQGVFAQELVPDEARGVVEGILDPGSRERLLLEIGRRFDNEESSRIGTLAEEHVAGRCSEELLQEGESDLADLVRRVSLVSDQLGYDVTAPRLDGSTRRLEVKGTRSSFEGAVVPFYLSRNEAERGITDPDWFLVACRIAEDGSVGLVGWVPSGEIEPYLPRDLTPESRWQSVRVALPENLFRPDLPPVRSPCLG